MEKEKLEIVLEEVLEDSKHLRGAVEELKQQNWQLNERIYDFEKKLDEMKLATPPVDIGPIQGIVRVSFDRIRQLLLELPKTVVHEKRFLLFPEHLATEYYRIIFRLVLWLTLSIAITYLFALGKQAIHNSKEVKLRELDLIYTQGAVSPLYDHHQAGSSGGTAIKSGKGPTGEKN